MIKLGGGCKDIITRSIDSMSGRMLIVHLLVDTRDAMGAMQSIQWQNSLVVKSRKSLGQSSFEDSF